MTSTSKQPAEHASPIASAAADGITPALAHARVRAASVSSMARSHARAETCSAAPPRLNTPANTASDGEEDSLPGPLEVDVEAIAAGHRLG